jgi:type IV secretory pathway VirB10-like protein
VRKQLLERMGGASAEINIWGDSRVTFQDANHEWKPFNSIRVPVAVEAPPAPPELQEEEAPPVPETDDVMQVVHSALKKVSRRASIAVATAQVAVQEADALRAELAEANRRASVAEAAHERVKEMLREMAQMAADLVQMAEEV